VIELFNISAFLERAYSPAIHKTRPFFVAR
jgi:hypothetical protein